MVRAEFTADPSRLKVMLKVKGHAGQNVYGHDIVCAGASTLATTLAQNALYYYYADMLKYSPRIKLKDGDAIIDVRAKTEEDYESVLQMFAHFQTGYQLMAHNYPDYVSVKMFGDDDKSFSID